MSHTCYLNEFRPLAATMLGQKAIEQHNLPPFIDASCRREPDMESAHPSITALCRGEHFAPRLRVGDVVGYMTKNLTWPNGTSSARRLVAVLRIERSWENHEAAAVWYREQGLPVPGNCMVQGSQPLPLDFTDRYKQDLRKWDLHYWQVVRKHGVFHACETIFCQLSDPPRLTSRQLVEWFGLIPDTRRHSPVHASGFAKLMQWLSQQPTGAVNTAVGR